MLDGFTGRILSRLVVSVVQILPSRPGGSRWANPVGQSTLDETNGFHRHVRHWHFCECPLGKKHLGNCNASASRSPMRTEPRPIRYDASASWGSTRYDASASGGGTIRREAPIPKRPGHFGTRVKTRNPLRSRAPKRQGGFSAKHQSAQTISTPRSRSLARFSASNPKRASSNPQSKPPRESTEFISFFAQAL